MDDDFTPTTNGGHVRVGDVERDRAATALGEHFSAGRLDRAELDARVAAALAARTEADLEALFTDLPDGAQPLALQHAVAAAHPAGVRPHSYFPIAIVTAALLLAVGAVTHGHPPVFLIPVFFWLRMRRCGRLRPGPGLR
jgi:uncharacterized protein DUF1707